MESTIAIKRETPGTADFLWNYGAQGADQRSITGEPGIVIGAMTPAQEWAIRTQIDALVELGRGNSARVRNLRATLVNSKRVAR